MKRLRISLSSLAVIAVLGAASFGSLGCKASVSAGEATPPPPPTPAPPPPDQDSDGIADADDACPDKAGPKNDDKAKNGCPEVKVAAVEEKKIQIVGTEVKITEKIMFDSGKATIKPESTKLLDEITAFLKTEGDKIQLIEVGGHADKNGNEKENLKLTDERAKAVVDALVLRGVDKSKLRAKGYGQYCPINPGSDPVAFEENRRVEFKILKMDGKATGVALGCAEAEKKGVKPAPVL